MDYRPRENLEIQALEDDSLITTIGTLYGDRRLTPVGVKAHMRRGANY